MVDGEGFLHTSKSYVSTGYTSQTQEKQTSLTVDGTVLKKTTTVMTEVSRKSSPCGLTEFLEKRFI